MGPRGASLFVLLCYVLLVTVSQECDTEVSALYYAQPSRTHNLTLCASSALALDGEIVSFSWRLTHWPAIWTPTDCDSTLPQTPQLVLNTTDWPDGLYRLELSRHYVQSLLGEHSDEEELWPSLDITPVYLTITASDFGEMLSTSDRDAMNRLHFPLKKLFETIGDSVPLLHGYAIFYQCFQDWTVRDSLYLSTFYQQEWNNSFRLNVSHYAHMTLIRRRTAMFKYQRQEKAHFYLPVIWKPEFLHCLKDYFAQNQANRWLNTVHFTVYLFYKVYHFACGFVMPFRWIAQWTYRLLF